MQRNTISLHLRLIAACLLCAARVHAAEPTVAGTMDRIVSRMQASLSQEQLLRLDEPTVQRFISREDRQVFATQYWRFEVNVPVVVSVMRDARQNELPFWLTEAGFRKTDLRVANEEYQYEVWQKNFGAGRVGLGINGLVKHRQHYFVCVGPQDSKAKLRLSHFFPADQQVLEMREGAPVYHDWSDLVLTQVPESLKGQKLLPTIRGRAREAQLVQAFRQTPFPSSRKPDQLVLTWSESPRTTRTIQWRTGPSVESGTVRYKAKNTAPTAKWREIKATRQTLEDRFLINNPRVHHFTATLRNLQPATTYLYSVGGAPDDSRTEPAEFTTAPDRFAPFTFVFLSDTHNSTVCGKLLAHALERFPETAFCTITGDLVGTGQYREDWDQLFDAMRLFANRRPVVPVVGNHDTIDGLGADLYLSLFGLPMNGAKRLQPERSYSLQYGNALFLVLDVTASVEDQTAWLEAQLARTKATWEFALFHFPPYSPGDRNPDIVHAWCPLFDKYHVDFVLSGHVHHSLRTHPLNQGRVVSSPDKGTIYMLTIALPNRALTQPQPDYVAFLDRSGLPVYQVFTIDGHRLVTRSCDLEGRIRDELVIEK